MRFDFWNKKPEDLDSIVKKYPFLKKINALLGDVEGGVAVEGLGKFLKQVDYPEFVQGVDCLREYHAKIYPGKLFPFGSQEEIVNKLQVLDFCGGMYLVTLKALAEAGNPAVTSYEGLIEKVCSDITAGILRARSERAFYFFQPEQFDLDFIGAAVMTQFIHIYKHLFRESGDFATYEDHIECLEDSSRYMAFQGCSFYERLDRMGTVACVIGSVLGSIVPTDNEGFKRACAKTVAEYRKNVHDDPNAIEAFDGLAGVDDGDENDWVWGMSAIGTCILMVNKGILKDTEPLEKLFMETGDWWGYRFVKELMD
jgi:hypothetical protein